MPVPPAPPAPGRGAGATRRATPCAGVLLPTAWAASAGPAGTARVVTTSTASWVSARSGAENQAKVMHSASPDDAQQRQRGQAVELGLPGGADGAGAPMPTAHSSTNRGVAGTRRGRPRSAARSGPSPAARRSPAWPPSQQQLRLQAPRAQPRTSGRAASGAGQRLEQALAVQAEQRVRRRSAACLIGPRSSNTASRPPRQWPPGSSPAAG
jgi:hypothetical protein